MVSLSYSSAIPSEAPPACLIVGEQANLQRIGFSDVESLISHRVSAKVGKGNTASLEFLQILKSQSSDQITSFSSTNGDC